MSWRTTVILWCASGIFVAVPNAVSAQRSSARSAPVVWERPAGCWGYCEPVWTACEEKTVRAEGREDALQLFTLVRGDTVHIEEGKVRVTAPRILVFRRVVHFVRDSDAAGPQSEDVPQPDSIWFQPGDTLFVYNWDSDGDGSGAWHVWFKGAHVAIDPYWLGAYAPNPGFEELQELRSEWWVRFSDSRQRGGWITASGMAGTAPHYEDGPERCARSR